MLTYKEIRARFELEDNDDGDDWLMRLHAMQGFGWDDGLRGNAADPEAQWQTGLASHAQDRGAFDLYTAAHAEGVKERAARDESGIVVIGTVGDVNAPEYSGGYIFRRPDGSCFLEYTHGLEDEQGKPGDSEDEEIVRLQVYSVEIADNVREDLNWLSKDDWKSIAVTHGQSPKELKADAESDDPRRRAYVYELVAGYYGWDNLDRYPRETTYGELCRDWQELPHADDGDCGETPETEWVRTGHRP